jgi:hypothetical protein
MSDLTVTHVYDTTEGMLCLLINGRKYLYRLDSALLPKLLKRLEKQPGKALAEIKEKSLWYSKET